MNIRTIATDFCNYFNEINHYSFTESEMKENINQLIDDMTWYKTTLMGLNNYIEMVQEELENDVIIKCDHDVRLLDFMVWVHNQK